MHETTLRPLTHGVWTDHSPVRFLGLHLTSTMTVLALTDGLLVHSPVPLTQARRAALERLGPVRHLYAPNTFHHLALGEWIAAFPNARVHAPAALATKRPDVRVDRAHDECDEPEFAGQLDEVRIRGFHLRESALVHRASGTAIVADLVHRIGRPEHAWTALYAKAAGFYDRVALSRVIQWTSFHDRAAARRSVDELVALPFDRLIVGHGDALETGGRNALYAAYAWLR